VEARLVEVEPRLNLTIIDNNRLQSVTIFTYSETLHKTNGTLFEAQLSHSGHSLSPVADSGRIIVYRVPLILNMTPPWHREKLNIGRTVAWK